MTKDERELLEANQRFYAAFAARDAAAMEALWAREVELVCLHPGWEPLLGRDPVLQSWRRILLGGGAPPGIRCEQPVARVAGSVGWVVCREIVPGGALAATNVFIREGDTWRLAHHHASPLPPPEERGPGGLPN